MSARISRRAVLQTGAGLAAVAAGIGRSQWAQAGTDTPHFFLQIALQGGGDNLYMFDSRPLAFRASGGMANYNTADPSEWTGANGGRCLAAPLTQALRPFKSKLAIINGVHMPSGFEGHSQNTNAILTANPFGGNYFGPVLATGTHLIDFLSLGSLSDISILNKQRGLSMADPSIAPSLATKAAQLGHDNSQPLWRQLVTSRLTVCGNGPGMMAEGCRSFASGLNVSQTLAAQLAGTSLSFGHNDSDLVKGVKVAMKYFTERVSDICLVGTDDFDFDTHSPEQAAKSPELFTKLIGDLALIFDLLTKTPFDESRGLSLLDVTTVMFSFEFGRTHGQMGKPVDKTGTDHNPQANSVILAGKGIRGDCVIGATDMDSLQANGRLSEVSAAHKALDQSLLKKMGKPYDFVSAHETNDLPEEYRISDYITIASVINTVMSAFSIRKDQWLTNDPSRRGGRNAPANPLTKALV